MKNKIKHLKFLLKQTEIFAHFLVGNKQPTTEETSLNKSKGKNTVRKRNVSSTKRENLSILKSIQESNDDIDDMEFESPHITRLLFQPSILTGGKLTEYQITGLNWLINLYETGLNGILADEMVIKILKN